MRKIDVYEVEMVGVGNSFFMSNLKELLDELKLLREGSTIKITKRRMTEEEIAKEPHFTGHV